MCLHVDQVCDGWPQCPERDDELLCDASCPSQCLCQGLAFVCDKPYNVFEHTDIKYLDASGSLMSVSDVEPLFHLVYLNLASCRISNLNLNFSLPNLQKLDLSSNSLQMLSWSHVDYLPNLRYLILKENYILSSIYFDSTSSKFSHSRLYLLDFSFTSINTFHIPANISIPSLKVLNVSFINQGITFASGLQGLSLVENLILESTLLHPFNVYMFQGMTLLSDVHADDFRACCKSVLPEGFNPDHCKSQENPVSSCESIISSNLFQGFYWITGFLVLFINLAYLVKMLLFSKPSNLDKVNQIAFLHIYISNVIFGIYMVIIAAATRVLSGRYIQNEHDWQRSIPCYILTTFYILTLLIYAKVSTL